MGEGTGIHSYALNLTRALLALESRHDFVIYCRRSVPTELRDLAGDNVTFSICPLRMRKLCEQVWLSFAAPRDRLDVLHCICSLPLLYHGPAVLSVLGFSWRLTPEVFTTPLRWYWILTAERTMKRATRLLAISHWTQRITSKQLGIPIEQIDVAHLGVNLAGFGGLGSATKEARVREKYRLGDNRFVLHVGSLIPVKNHGTLIRAFGTLVRRDDLADLKLVLAGGKGWGADELFTLVARLGLEDRVVFTGFVDSDDLPTLYRAAALFAFPSLYEGFGLPVLESFAAGTPVVSSNASCLPEVGGDAAIYVDPRDESELAEAIASVLTDADLRNTLSAKGRERVRLFTWEETARKTLRVYEKAGRVAS